MATRSTSTGKKKASKEVGFQLSPRLQEMMAMAEQLAKSKLVPMAYASNPAGIFAAIQYGKELGLPAMTSLQNIAVINGKPTLGTDMFLALAHRHKEWRGYEIEVSTVEKAVVHVYRYVAGIKKIVKFTGTFTMEEARKAGLWRAGSPWEKWPKRMLKHRATAFALRDGFSDVLAGQYMPDEMDPDGASMQEIQEAAAQDEMEASVLDERGVPVETVKVIVDEAPKKKTASKRKIQ